MKPKFLCPECEGELQWGDKFCASCGKTVEWPTPASVPQMADRSETIADQHGTVSLTCLQCGTENTSNEDRCSECGVLLGTAARSLEPKKQTEAQRSQRTKAPKDASAHGQWKVLAGFVAFLALGVLLLESLTRDEHNPQPQQPAQTVPAANMQALSQIEEFEKRIAANPDDASLYLHLAHLLQDNRFYDKAIASYNRYLEKNPKDTDARVDLGICYHDTGNFDEAKRQMERALKESPKHLLAHFNLGIVNLSANNLEEANKWFQRTAALAPESEIGQRAQRMLTQHSTISQSSTN